MTRFAVFLVLVAFLLAAPCLAQAERPEAVLFVNTPYPPYNLGGYGPAEGGIAVDIAREVCSRLGIGLRYELHPFKRVLTMLERGTADGSCVLRKTEARERFMAYSVPLFTAQEAVYFNRRALPGFRWDALADLRGRRIGLVRDYAYSRAFQDAVREHGLAVEYASSNVANFRKLASGRVDVVVCNAALIPSLLDEHPEWAERVGRADKVITAYEDYLTVSRRSALMDLLPEIDRVIKAMRADGTMDAILAQE